jgi:hypothetical protein
MECLFLTDCEMERVGIVKMLRTQHVTNPRATSSLTSSLRVEIQTLIAFLERKKKVKAAHDMCYVQNFTGLLCIIVSSLTFFPWLSPFLFCCNKIIATLLNQSLVLIPEQST